MSWTAGNKNEMARALRQFWPKEFESFKGEPYDLNIKRYVDAVGNLTPNDVFEALAKLKSEDNPEKAPKVEVLVAIARRWKESTNPGARKGTFPKECWGVIVRGLTSGHGWEATSTGAYGPNAQGEYRDATGRPFFWPLIARKDFPAEALPEGVYQAILKKGAGLKAAEAIPEEREREYTAQEVAANDAMWRGRIDHPDPEMRRIYRRMRAYMAQGAMPTGTPRMREPGED